MAVEILGRAGEAGLRCLHVFCRARGGAPGESLAQLLGTAGAQLLDQLEPIDGAEGAGSGRTRLLAQLADRLWTELIDEATVAVVEDLH